MSHAMKVSFESIDYYYMIGTNIAYYRRLAGLTQAQLAEKVGVSRVHCLLYTSPSPRDI